MPKFSMRASRGHSPATRSRKHGRKWRKRSRVRGRSGTCPIERSRSTATGSTYRLLTADEAVDMPPTTWLIPGLIPENSFAAVYGPPGSLKSFCVLDLALRLAYGMPWLNKALRPCDVLYVAAEGAGSFGKRIEAWRELNAVTDSCDRFRLLPQTVNLMDEADLQRLVLTVKEAAEGDFR